MSEAVAGLVGALIGALAALGAQWLTIRHQRRTDRRRELVDIVARFWDSADRLWRASEGLDYTILSLSNAESSKNVELVRLYEERRIDGLRRHHEAETESRFLIAQMRLLYPRIADQAGELIDSSLLFEHRRRDELRATRQKALDAYERAASALLGRTR